MLRQHQFYNTERYPNYITTDGSWSIWANGAGNCVSIPTPKQQRLGLHATYYGDMSYVKLAKRIKLYPS